jgi:hypothetical protein
MSYSHGLALLTAALAWLQPPPVLPLPSRSGPDGPPRPVGVQPAAGGPAAPTGPQIAAAQDRMLLAGPFPHGGLERGISDGGLFLNGDPTVRGLAMARTRATGAAVVRIPINWASLISAPGSGGAPSSGEAPSFGDFDASDPASPRYDFTATDAAVRSAVAAGLQPLLVVTHAPDFAEAPDRWRYAYPGSWAPNPNALRSFAVALARRYDGSFPDPLGPGRSLPRVRLYQAWNEPNLARYLEPQWVAVGRHWSPFSPLLYRQLLNGFYAGVKSVSAGDLVISAGVAPNGDPAGSGRIAPVTFLRGMLCLENRVRCLDPPHFDVLAFHPLSVGNPDHAARSALDVSIADAGKVTGLLAAAERHRTALPVARKQVWVTELNWESAPAAAHGVPARLQAAWVSRALHRLWVAGVSLVDWQFLVDPYPSLYLGNPTGGGFDVARPAGLYAAAPGGNPANAAAKPFLSGFTFPFDPLRVDRGHIRVWALLRASGAGVSLQRLGRAGGWRTIARLHADAHGVLNALVALTGRLSLRLQGGGLNSAVARVSADRTGL